MNRPFESPILTGPVTIKTASVASASTVDLTSTSSAVTITGTTPITSFGTGVAGALRHITFSGALLLTYNATSLILPGGANITTAAGDTMVLEGLGSGNWRVRDYTPAALVQVNATKPLILCIGDSLTASTSPPAWPTEVATNLPTWQVANVAIDGTQARMWAESNYTWLTNPYYSSARSSHVAVVWAGTNDLFVGRTDTQVKADLTTYVTALKATGYRVVIVTIIPNGAHDATAQTRRASVNAYINAGSTGADAVVDLTALSQFDAQADTANTTYYNADTTHLKAPAYALIAPLIQAACLQVARYSFGRVGSLAGYDAAAVGDLTMGQTRAITIWDTTAFGTSGIQFRRVADYTHPFEIGVAAVSAGGYAYMLLPQQGLVAVSSLGVYGFMLDGAGIRAGRMYLGGDVLSVTGSQITRLRHGTATLVAGVATVSDAYVTISTRILVTRNGDGGTPGCSYSITRTASTSFTITSKRSDGTTTETSDTSTIAWWSVEP